MLYLPRYLRAIHVCQSNIIPLRISIVLLRSKRCSTELPLRAGLCKRAGIDERL